MTTYTYPVGAPSYDADGYRSRRLAVLDRAAGTGLVPAALLARWERALEEVSLWRFPTCVTHGPLEGHDVFWNGHVSAISSWENASVSDPADDFAWLTAVGAPGTMRPISLVRGVWGEACSLSPVQIAKSTPGATSKATYRGLVKSGWMSNRFR